MLGPRHVTPHVQSAVWPTTTTTTGMCMAGEPGPAAPRAGDDDVRAAAPRRGRAAAPTATRRGPRRRHGAPPPRVHTLDRSVCLAGRTGSTGMLLQWPPIRACDTPADGRLRASLGLQPVCGASKGAPYSSVRCLCSCSCSCCAACTWLCCMQGVIYSFELTQHLDDNGHADPLQPPQFKPLQTCAPQS